MLRLPREMSTEQKKQRVAKVIAALGLNRCKDTIIGLPPHLFCTDTSAFIFCCLPPQHVLLFDSSAYAKAHLIICQGTQIVLLPVCAPVKHEPSIRSPHVYNSSSFAMAAHSLHTRACIDTDALKHRTCSCNTYAYTECAAPAQRNCRGVPGPCSCRMLAAVGLQHYRCCLA